MLPVRKKILNWTVLLSLIGSYGAAIDTHCQSGKDAGGKITVERDYICNIVFHDRDKDNLNRSRVCLYRVLSKDTIPAAGVLLELLRGQDQQAALGDALPNATVSLTKNGSRVRLFTWGERNVSFIRLARGEAIDIEANIDNATAASMNNDLFLRLTVAVIEVDQHRGSKVSSTRYALRSAEFLCGSAALDDCSLLVDMAAQFTSAAAINELLLAPFSAGLKKLLSKPALLGLRCCNGSVAFHQENSSSSISQWEPVAGIDHSCVCNSSKPASFVTLRATNATTISGNKFALSSDVGSSANLLVVIDLVQTADPPRNASSCAASGMEFSQSDHSESFLKYLAITLAALFVSALVLVFIVSRFKRSSSEHQSGDAQESQPFESRA